MRLVVAILFLAVVGCAATIEEEWVVTVDGDPTVYARAHNLSLKGLVPYLLPESRMFIYTRQRRQHERLAPLEGGELQTKARQRLFTRTADPLYEQQWHLHSHPSSMDADHASDSSGRGITIAIVDDGLQHAHPDLAPNYDAQHSWDFNDRDHDPTPLSEHPHGTAAAGVAAAAANNGHCGRGVAPQARLVGLRTIAAPVTDLTEGAALAHNAIGVVDIYSCSWGPVDDGISMEGPGNVVTSTLQLYAGAARGRLGKGSIYVWAAGNGRGNSDSCAFDGYASSLYTIPVGALDSTGQQAWYSESCPALMCVAPSSGTDQRITTVDLQGPAGYDPGECTDSFGGTSSAAPAVAGAIALVLQLRPELSWRDIKHIIARGAMPIQTQDPDWHINAAGYHHSHKFGFGLLKIPRLLAAARAHVKFNSTQFTNTNMGPRMHY